MRSGTPYVQTGPYQDIISGIQLIFSFSDGVVRLTGPDGVGKSSLLDALLDMLQDDEQLALLFKLPPRTPQELQNHLTRELALPANMGFRKALARFVTARPRDRQQLILLFDDAHLLDEEALLGLLQLRELSHNGHSLISIVLAGLPSLNAQLALPAVAEAARDFALSYELGPLDKQQLESFCKAAISAQGLSQAALGPKALQHLHEQSKGLPGEVLALLPALENEPEATALPASSAGENAPQTPLRQVPAPSRPQPASAALSRFRLPFATVTLRQALSGGAAVAATAAAACLLYPQLAPLWQGDSSTPAADLAMPAAVPVPAPTPATATDAPPAAETAEDTVATPALATLTPPEPLATPPPPASSPVSVVPVIPAAARQDASPEALEAVVRDWIAAWQSQDLEGYFGAYHTDFAPLYQRTRTAWRENRRRSITGPEAISIALEDFTINGDSVVGTHVSFWLQYQTSTYADRTLKELVIGHDLDGSLRILQEINRQVTTLAPSQLPDGTATSSMAATDPSQDAEPPASEAEATATRTRIGAPVQLATAPTLAADALDTGPAIDSAAGVELRDFVSSWLQAWQRQDTAAYFSHYTSAFHASAFTDRAAWEADRIRKITRPLAIQIHLQNLQVLSATATRSELELQMEYHSSYYADRTRKALQLTRGTGGNWQISDERNLQVEALPLARLVPGTTLTLRSSTNTIFERAL